MATLKVPFALDRSLNTTEQASRNIADVLAEELSAIITALGGLNFINYEVVEELPTTGISTTTIYLVPSDDPQSGNTYDEYINLNGTVSGWEKIGSTAIDLSGYYTSAETDALLDEKVDKDSFDEQTATDEFTTINGGLLSECKVALTPNQDLHGYDHPWVGGAGKNKMPITATSQTISGVNITVNDDGSIHASGTATVDIYLALGETSVGANTWIASCGVVGSWSSYGIYIRNITDGETINMIDSQNYTFTLSATKTIRFVLLIKSGQTVNTDFYPMLRLSTESDPTFAPYSNICPISGHTEVKVGDDGKNRFDPNSYESFDITGGGAIRYGHEFDSGSYTLINNGTGNSGYFYRIVAKDYSSYGSSVQIANNTSVNVDVDDAHFLLVFTSTWDDTADKIAVIEGTNEPFVPYNGYQVTVNLGGTYYSGTLDVVSGVFVVDKVKAVTPTRGALDLSGKLYTINFSGGTIHNYDNGVIATPYVMCSHLDVDSLAGARDTQRKCICQYARGVYIGGYIGEETALDNMLASADFSIVFELATPTPIQLSPTMVKALVGENHLSAPLDGQEITESKYKQMFTFDDVIAYIQSLS